VLTRFDPASGVSGVVAMPDIHKGGFKILNTIESCYKLPDQRY
jgi:hypothetical protein